MNEIEEMFEYLAQFNVDGHTISPAYGYSAVNDREIFMTRDDIHEKFKDIDKLAERFPLVQHAHLPRIPARQARLSLHGLGQSDIQREGLERPVLPDHGRSLPDFRGTDDQNASGKTTEPATIRAATIAWCIAVLSPRRRWESIRSSATRSS